MTVVQTRDSDFKWQDKVDREIEGILRKLRTEGFVRAELIADDAIGPSHIAPGTINDDHVDPHSLTGTSVAFDSLTAEHIEARSLTGYLMAVNSLTAEEIASRTITALEIAVGTLTATEIAAGSITGDRIAAGTLTAIQIQAASITGALIAGGTITATNIQVGTLTGALLASATITGDKLVADTITSREIVGTTLSAITADLGTVTAGTMRIGVAGGQKVAIGDAISTSTGTKSGIVGTDSSNAITFWMDSATGDLQLKGQILSGSSGLGNITGQIHGTTNVQPTTIAGDRLLANTITATQIAAATITSIQIAAATITGSNIAAGTITAANIAVGTITADRMNVVNLSAISANLGTITAGTLTGTTFQTELSGARVVLDSTGLKKYDADGFTPVAIGPLNGMELFAGTSGSPPNDRRIRWVRESGGTLVAEIYAYEDTDNHGGIFKVQAPSTKRPSVDIQALGSNTASSASLSVVGRKATDTHKSAIWAGAGASNKKILDEDGASDYMFATGLNAPGWTAWTPSWTADGGTNPTLGNGTLVGRYFRIGKLVVFTIALTLGSTTTKGSGGWSFQLPVSGAAGTGDGRAVGNASLTDFGSARWAGWVRLDTVNTVRIDAPIASNDVRLTDVGPSTPFVWTNPDSILLTGAYETA